jgi:hypothetical protein
MKAPKVWAKAPQQFATGLPKSTVIHSAAQSVMFLPRPASGVLARLRLSNGPGTHRQAEGEHDVERRGVQHPAHVHQVLGLENRRKALVPRRSLRLGLRTAVRQQRLGLPGVVHNHSQVDRASVGAGGTPPYGHTAALAVQGGVRRRGGAVSRGRDTPRGEVVHRGRGGGRGGGGVGFLQAVVGDPMERGGRGSAPGPAADAGEDALDRGQGDGQCRLCNLSVRNDGVKSFEF